MTVRDALSVAFLTVLWAFSLRVMFRALIAVRRERQRHAEFIRRANVFQSHCDRIRATPDGLVDFDAERRRLHVLAAWVEEMAGGER